MLSLSFSFALHEYEFVFFFFFIVTYMHDTTDTSWLLAPEQIERSNPSASWMSWRSFPLRPATHKIYVNCKRLSFAISQETGKRKLQLLLHKLYDYD